MTYNFFSHSAPLVIEVNYSPTSIPRRKEATSIPRSREGTGLNFGVAVGLDSPGADSLNVENCIQLLNQTSRPTWQETKRTTTTTAKV
jgi:hypothetical protein